MLVQKFNYDILCVMSEYMDEHDAQNLQLVDRYMYDFVYNKQAGFLRKNFDSKWLFFNPKLLKLYQQKYKSKLSVKIAKRIYNKYDDLTYEQIECIWNNTNSSKTLINCITSKWEHFGDNINAYSQFRFKINPIFYFDALFTRPDLLRMILNMNIEFTIIGCYLQKGIHTETKLKQYLELYRIVGGLEFFKYLACKSVFDKNYAYYTLILDGNDSDKLNEFYKEVYVCLIETQELIEWDTPRNEKIHLIAEFSYVDSCNNFFTDEIYNKIMECKY